MKRIGVWLLLSAGHAGWASASESGPDKADPLAIVVDVLNQTDIPQFELRSALDQARRTLRAAGVETRWESGAAADQGAAAQLTVVLLSPEMTTRKCTIDNIGPDVLGTAAPAAGRAWIFTSRILAWASQLGLPPRDILGQVITHEVGHLLLPDVADRRAVMRGQALSSGVGYFRFTRHQAEQMRARLRGTVALAAHTVPQ